MRHYILLFSVIAFQAVAQNPGQQWHSYADPAMAGFSIDQLNEAKQFYDDSTAFGAGLIVHKGNIVTSWGATTQRFLLASVRKSLLHSLIGRAIDEGQLNIESTLAELGIDDITPLTSQEKEARVKHLLSITSGVYLPAAFEDKGWAERKPARGSHAPGTFWYYNNWDFNTLCTIYETASGKKIFGAFENEIAKPLGMEDFRIEDGVYDFIPESRHPAYLFKMSSRDLARFGVLYLNNGQWNKKQVVPESWIDVSTKEDRRASGNGYAYGYLWWTTPVNGMHVFAAHGAGTQVVYVVPGLELVVVLLTNTYVGNSTSDDHAVKLLTKILDAKSLKATMKPNLIPMQWPKQPTAPVVSGEGKPNIFGDYKHPRYGEFTVVREKSGVVLAVRPGRFNLKLIGDNEYFIEDMNLVAKFVEAKDEAQKNTCGMGRGDSGPQLTFYY